MIIARDRSFVICTPKKTGTHSLKSVLCDHSMIAISMTPWHGRQWHLAGRRYLVVRHPLERFVSMYYFVHRVKSAWLKSHALHFGEWATAFFKAKPGTNDDWQFNLCQYADEFNPDVIIHTEHLQAGLTKILRSHGKDSLRLIGNLNATKDRPTMTEALDLLEHDTHLQLMQWAQADAERFGYDL